MEAGSRPHLGCLFRSLTRWDRTVVFSPIYNGTSGQLTSQSLGNLSPPHPNLLVRGTVAAPLTLPLFAYRGARTETLLLLLGSSAPGTPWTSCLCDCSHTAPSQPFLNQAPSVPAGGFPGKVCAFLPFLGPLKFSRLHSLCPGSSHPTAPGRGRRWGPGLEGLVLVPVRLGPCVHPFPFQALSSLISK